jgi:hypothetical protein
MENSAKNARRCTREPRSTLSRRLLALVLAQSLALGALGVAGDASAQGRRGRTAAANDRATIVLHRRVTVGQRKHITAEGTADSALRVSVGSEVVQDTHRIIRVTLDAESTVLAIDEHGKATAERLVIARFTRAEGDATQADVVPAGTIMEIHRAPRSEDARVLVAGAAAGEAIVEALDAVTSVRSGGATDDDFFGSARPRRVGESWNADGAAMSADLHAASGIEAAVTGRATFTGREQVDGVDCVAVDARIEGNVTALPGLPPNSTVRVGRLVSSFRGAFPTDTAIPAVDHTMTMDFTVEVDFTAEGHPGNVHMRNQTERHVHVQLLH